MPLSREDSQRMAMRYAQRLADHKQETQLVYSHNGKHLVLSRRDIAPPDALIIAAVEPIMRVKR